MAHPPKKTSMFKNYLTVAWRNMRNNKVYSALNIVGLAMGMAVALLIGLWVVNEYAYDRFLPNYQQAYQVRFNYVDQRKGIQTNTAVSLPLAEALLEASEEKQAREGYGLFDCVIVAAVDLGLITAN